MTREVFEKLIEEEFPNAVPEKFRHLMRNVVFLADNEPSDEVRRAEGLLQDETLLGLYHGVPATARGDWYGVGGTLPDTITLYQNPIEDEATHLQHTNKLEFVGMLYEELVRKVVRETIWHEVAHHFGYDETQVREREARDEAREE